MRRSEFICCLNRINMAAKYFLALAQLDGGEEVNRTKFAELIEEARKEALAGIPAYVCNCRARVTDCPFCKGRRWLTERQMQQKT